MSGRDLTPEQKITATYVHLIWDVPQMALACIYGVNNGRINEAIKLVTHAVGLSDGGYVVTNPERQAPPTKPAIVGGRTD